MVGRVAGYMKNRFCLPPRPVTSLSIFITHLDETIDGDDARNVSSGDISGRMVNSGHASAMVTVAAGAHLHFSRSGQ